MNKYDYNSHITYYQKARFFRKTNTNEFAYCIEPFKIFNENSNYSSTSTPNKLTDKQIDKITKIAHFGYGYKDHTDPKWYAITQFMIWKESENGDYYFTDYLNGNRITRFENEMNEINNLINNYQKIPNLNNNYTIISGNELIIEDNNLIDFKVIGDNAILENNKLLINPTKEGTYTYNLLKEDNIYNKPYIFYQSSNSQDLIKTGDINSLNINFTVDVIKTEIELTKIDKDSKSILPKGEASLDGAVFSLYDENNNHIKDLEIINNQSIINNIPFGKYYLKEIKPGIGYSLNNNTYEVIISKEKSKHQVIVENKVIEKNITIEKKYGDTNTLLGEKDISFEIYNKIYEKISTITTNESGIAEITLPYGEYTFKQLNTTDGYTKVNDFTITIDNTNNELIELKDLKIEVPNTSTNNYLLIEIIKLLLRLW